ncbi:uncharacterized protein LOC123296805 [Chrysoperla carnea]|uniref:uncharacterized protein LOC123296805 n=1 Tax=Chrysoperla carnea TaxID=189513 RepID=UPI001D06E086|nr:uncharacterized protein LOC123296805 [Chrysoperla carnea]
MGTFIPFLNAVKSSVSIVFLTLIISLTTTVHHGIAENVYSNVHKDMNLDEIRSIFHVDSHLEVPEYEVIHIKPNRPSHNDEDSSTASSTEYDYINQQNIETTTTLIDEADYMLIDEEPTGNKINNDQHSTDNSIVVDNKSESKLVKDGDKNKKFSKKYPKKTTPGLSNNVNVLSSNEQADKDHLETVIPLNNGVRGLKIFTVEPNVTSQHGVDYVEIQQVNIT